MPDQEAIDQQRELLAIYRQSLAFHLKQVAKQGDAFAAPALLHGIAEARAQIHALKRSLRHAGVDVEDLALDEEHHQAAPSPPLLGQTSSKSSVYKTLWGKIEELHILVRIHDVERQDFDKNLQELNIFTIRHSLDIDQEDQKLANDYLQMLYQLKGIVNAAGSAQERRTVEITGALAAEDFQSGVELQQLVAKFAIVRNLLYQRFRHIINAPVRG